MKLPLFPVFILVLFAIGLLPVPALAELELTADPSLAEFVDLGSTSGMSYDVSAQGKAIQKLVFTLPTGTDVQFTLYYGDNSTVSGTMSYFNDGFMSQHILLSMGGTTVEKSYNGIQELGRADLVGYARNKTGDNQYVNGLLLFDQDFGTIFNNPLLVFYPVTDASDNIIYRIDWSSNNPVYLTASIDDRAKVSKAVGKTTWDVINEYVNLAITVGTTVKDILISLFYWAKFFLWDNLLMTVALYIAITAAISFNATRNVFKAISKFISYQKKLWEFVLGIWERLVNILGTVRGIFRI